MMNIARRSALLPFRRVVAFDAVYFSTPAMAEVAVPAAPAGEVKAAKKDRKPRHTEGPKKVQEVLNVQRAILEVKAAAWAKFDETVEVSINTGLDPRKPNQSVKGVARLPFGTGKKIRICVVATGPDTQTALEAGADVAGLEDVIKMIQGGDVAFDALIATPEVMPALSKLGRILGPRGLMPNPKMGTVTKDIAKAVRAAKAGAIQFKVEKKGVIQAGIGKVSFTHEALMENLRSFMMAVQEVKPEGFKGKYIVGVYLSSTMGPGFKIDLPAVDPASPRFMLDM